jgi:hypothetical protein
MMDMITLVLPVIWAIVATIIGIVLYRTSSALFHSVERSKTRTRTIRLTGSVAIAAFAFFAMKLATPTERLRTTNTVVASQIGEIERATLEAQAALTNDDPSTCRAALTRITAATTAVRTAMGSGLR